MEEIKQKFIKYCDNYLIYTCQINTFTDTLEKEMLDIFKSINKGVRVPIFLTASIRDSFIVTIKYIKCEEDSIIFECEDDGKQFDYSVNDFTINTLLTCEYLLAKSLMKP